LSIYRCCSSQNASLVAMAARSCWSLHRSSLLMGMRVNSHNSSKYACNHSRDIDQPSFRTLVGDRDMFPEYQISEATPFRIGTGFLTRNCPPSEQLFTSERVASLPPSFPPVSGGNTPAVHRRR